MSWSGPGEMARLVIGVLCEWEFEKGGWEVIDVCGWFMCEPGGVV